MSESQGLALAATSVSVHFGEHHALESVDLAVPAGEIRAIIGPNGAGKSTLFGVLAGERRPAVGSVHVNGADVTRVSPRGRVRLGIGRTFQVSRVLADLSVEDNILASLLAREGRMYRFWRPVLADERRRAVALLDTVGLMHRRKAMAGQLPQGDKKRLEIVCAMALQPKALLLDEPTAGMSPEETAATVSLLRELWRASHITIVLTEHDMSVVFGLAQQITVLHRGQIVCTDTPQAVQDRADVQDIYLGEE